MEQQSLLSATIKNIMSKQKRNLKGPSTSTVSNTAAPSPTSKNAPTSKNSAVPSPQNIMSKQRKNLKGASTSTPSNAPSNAAGSSPTSTNVAVQSPTLSNAAAHSPTVTDVTPNIDDIDPVADMEAIAKKSRTRGPTMLKSLFKSAAKNKIEVSHNDFGQPIGDGAARFESVCGYVSRNGVLCPLTIPRWDKMPEAFKDAHINFLKRYFIFDEKVMETYIKKDIGKKWKDWKCSVRSQFELDQSIEHNLQKQVDRVDPNQWTQLVVLWDDVDNRKISEKAKMRKLKQKTFHTCGRTSYARKRDAMEKARGGEEVGDIEFFQETHSNKEGIMDDNAIEILDKCAKIIEERNLDVEEVSNDINLQGEIMRKVRGEERPGRVRLRGLGVTPTMLSSHKKMKGEMDDLKKSYDARFEAMQKKHETEMEKIKGMLESVIAAQIQG